MEGKELVNIKLKRLVDSIYLKAALFLMILSYFYNLPVINYSLKGKNEFRLYDVVGIVIVFICLKNYGLLAYYINSKKHFRYLKYFLLWTLFTFFITAIFAIFKSKYLFLIQTLLYYYHFVVFFLNAVLLSIFLLYNESYYTKILNFIFFLIILETLLVIAQNNGLVPFLWNVQYYIAYNGFLSGSLGPNKIVLGMTMFISFVLCLGIFIQKGIKVNKILLYGALTMSLTAVLISGSRTTYLALIVFAAFVLIMNTGKFLRLASIIGFIVIISLFLNLGIVELVASVFESRITNKISDPILLRGDNVDIDLLYQDLGSGRKGLSLSYLKYLFENPHIIPFGLGFNNRMIIGFSAHNTYLTLIKEVGLVGVYLYFRWLSSYYFLNLGKSKYTRIALKGLVVAMLVTLFFGEHLYVYRPLFGILGFFLVVTVLLIAPRYYYKN